MREQAVDEGAAVLRGAADVLEEVVYGRVPVIPDGDAVQALRDGELRLRSLVLHYELANWTVRYGPCTIVPVWPTAKTSPVGAAHTALSIGSFAGSGSAVTPSPSKRIISP